MARKGVHVTDYCGADDFRRLEAQCAANLCEVNARQRQLYLKMFLLARHMKIKSRLRERQKRKAGANG